MSKINDGGAAFPHSIQPDFQYAEDGMSLRDWFAGQALASVVALVGIPEDGPDDLWDASIATQSYAMADAMLKAREGGAL